MASKETPTALNPSCDVTWAISPVFAAQPLDALEFASIAGRHDEPASAGLPAVQDVVAYDGGPRALNRGVA